MIQNPQLGGHLDADQLSMFVDGKASSHERERILKHLVQCQECRKVIFLMQGQAEPESTASIAKEKWPWRRWVMPLGLAGAVLASSLVWAVYVQTHHAREIATLNAPRQTPLAKRSEAPAANNPGSTREGDAERNEKAKSIAPSIPARAKGLGVLEEEKSAGTSLAASQTAKKPTLRNQLASPIEKPGANAADSAARTETANHPALAPPLEGPTEGKNTKDLGEPVSAKILPMLRIEHDRGPVDGSSEVNGRVTDQTGAVVRGAQISLRDAAGKVWQTTSRGDGSFSMAGFPPGHYDLRVTATGFQSSEQTMDLKSRDVAMLDSVLKVGASTETVAVAAQPMVLNTESASVASIQVPDKLPSRLPATATARLGKRVLSLDEAGTLFISRNGGRSWKKVKPQWTGKVTRIEPADGKPDQVPGEGKKETAEAETQPRFELTTDKGAIWTSADGTHWHAR